jgi:DNA-binding FrmR family transcriptional regulator
MLPEEVMIDPKRRLSFIKGKIDGITKMLHQE